MYPAAHLRSLRSMATLLLAVTVSYPSPVVGSEEEGGGSALTSWLTGQTKPKRARTATPVQAARPLARLNGLGSQKRASHSPPTAEATAAPTLQLPAPEEAAQLLPAPEEAAAPAAQGDKPLRHVLQFL